MISLGSREAWPTQGVQRQTVESEEQEEEAREEGRTSVPIS